MRWLALYRLSDSFPFHGYSKRSTRSTREVLDGRVGFKGRLNLGGEWSCRVETEIATVGALWQDVATRWATKEITMPHSIKRHVPKFCQSTDILHGKLSSQLAVGPLYSGVPARLGLRGGCASCGELRCAIAFQHSMATAKQSSFLLRLPVSGHCWDESGTANSLCTASHRFSGLGCI